MAPLYVWMRMAFAALVMLVTWLTLTSNPDNTESGFVLARVIATVVFSDPALADKVAHFLAYAALGAFSFWGRLHVQAFIWLTPLILAAYGGGLELLQGLGGIRQAEFADAFANALGACAGYLGAYILSRLMALRAA